MNKMMPKDYPKVLFQNRKPDRIATLDAYRESGGYSALTRVLERESHAAVKQQILDAVLLGRGGAAFPAGKKMETVADDAPFPRYIVCNADEMEPGTFKDRVLIHADPHMLIEGMIITGYGILIDFFARESCGWCTPCREGLPYIRDLLARIEVGGGRRGVYSRDRGYEPALGECLLRFCTGGRGSGGEPFDLFGGRGAGAYRAEEMSV